VSTFSKNLLLVGSVVMVFVVIAAAALLSQGSGSITPQKAATKQYTVEKSRTSARGIASSDRKVADAQGYTSPNERVQSMTPDAKPKATRVQVPVKTSAPVTTTSPKTAMSDAVAAIIAEAHAAASTEAATDMLARAIADAQSPADTSRLYAAVGSLQLAKTPPDAEAGLAALRSATETAVNPEARSNAAVTEASALVVHGDTESSLTRIGELLNDESINTKSAQHLTLMRGDLLIEGGDLKAAESAYEAVRSAAAPADGNDEALFRQASLRLARLYSRTGDEKKEEAITRELQRAFAAR
jgi:predicted negative regulator of RcsB-dependent stress response